MGLLERATADIEKYSSDDKFGFAATLIFRRPAPDSETIEVKGLFSDTTQDVIDNNGNIVNSRKIHCAFSEKFMIDGGYEIRDSRGEIDLSRHRVSVVNMKTRELKNYIVASWHPDESVGFITCILQKLKDE